MDLFYHSRETESNHVEMTSMTRGMNKGSSTEESGVAVFSGSLESGGTGTSDSGPVKSRQISILSNQCIDVLEEIGTAVLLEESKVTGSSGGSSAAGEHVTSGQPEEINLEEGPELIYLQERNQKTSTSEISEISEGNVLGRSPQAAGDNSSRLALALIQENTKPQTASAIQVDSVRAQQTVPKSKTQQSKVLYTVRAVVDNPGGSKKLAFSTGDEIAVYDDTTYTKHHLGKLLKSELHALSGKKLFFKPQDVVKIEEEVKSHVLDIKTKIEDNNPSPSVLAQIDDKPKPTKSKVLYTVRAVVDNPGGSKKLAFSTGDEIAVYDDTTYTKHHLGKLIKSELHALSGKKLFFKPQDVVKIEAPTSI